MLRRHFKFFQDNPVLPYRNYALEHRLTHESNETPLIYWSWIDDVTHTINEPDGYLRVYSSQSFRNITFTDFLTRYRNYDIYIYSIMRIRNNHRFVITMPLDETPLRYLIDYHNDNLDIEAIII